MHIEGRQIYQMNLRLIAFRICETCYRQKLTVWPENRFFAKKKTTLKSPILDTNLGYLSLEGPGRQTVDTRSTWGYDGTNLLYGGSGASKLSTHAPPTFFSVVTQILVKKCFFGKMPRTQKISTGPVPTESLCTLTGMGALGLSSEWWYKLIEILAGNH